ncbi:MAG TPA: hemerythrin domain-containing protein [Acidimicrobiales bacterium]|nr:hemerythrin domain-containing protein [Acidimicrobiales bacterium]
MDAIALLVADHNRVRGVFARFKAAEESGTTEVMGDLATKIIEELDIHATIEEEIFYPKVREQSEELGKLVAEGIEEHNVVKGLIAEIKGGDPTDEAWVAKVKVLIENVEHHAGEEEDEMFPKVRSGIDAATRGTIGDQLAERKVELGAPSMAETIDLTQDALLELARAQEIPGRSSMSHEELAATVDPRG